jgi:DNA polymerase I-like protein with 3'-5' exonuclease and polymerase domains
VNTVHDSVIVELPPEEVEDFHVLSQRCLIDEVYFYLEQVYNMRLVVPLGAGVMVGKNWSDSEAKASEVIYTAEEGMYGTIECGAEA